LSNPNLYGFNIPGREPVPAREPVQIAEPVHQDFVPPNVPEPVDAFNKFILQDPPRRPPRPPHHGPQEPPRHTGAAPTLAPPDYIPTAPQIQDISRLVESGAINRCLFTNTYVWLTNRSQFWFYPTFVGRRSIAGFRWMHGRWVYMGFDLNMIESFFCG
jgi:hypothetical protein